MIKINSSYKYLLFFFALIALISFCEISNSADQDGRDPVCAATLVTGTRCETQPTTQSIIFHKVAFCTALPIAPTNTTATGMTNCSTVFENTAGATVSIQKGTGVTPAGTFTDPPYGNYTFAYVELNPVITYKANLFFTNANALSSVGEGTGPNCHTNGTAYFYWDTLKGITCTGAFTGVAVDTTNTINSLDNNAALYIASTTEGTNPGTTHGFLIKSNGTLATTSSSGNIGDVAKLVFFMPMTANITPDTISFNLLYNNTRGMIVWQNEVFTSGAYRTGFSAAFFDMVFQIQ
jgi:hypothetical protein